MISAADPYSWEGRAVDVTTIERHLSDLWKHLPLGSNAETAVRTHMFNLVIYVETATQLTRIARLTQLTSRQPSRSIILYPDRSPGEPCVDAHLSLRCRPGGQGEAKFCHEQVVLTVHGRAADHLASVVVPLLMPELPTYLWWPGHPPFGYRFFHRLLDTADQLIVDSAQFESPGDGLAELAQLCTNRFGINDIHWARLTPWREIIAQFFDGPVLVPYLNGFRSVAVEFGAGHGTSSSAISGLLLAVGWLARLLSWQPETALEEVANDDTTITVLQGERLIPIEVRFRDHGQQAAHRLMGLEIVSQPQGLPPGRFEVHRTENLYQVNVSMQIHDQLDIKRLLPLGVKSDDELLSDELELAGEDKLYSEVVREAARLAGREVFTRV